MKKGFNISDLDAFGMNLFGETIFDGSAANNRAFSSNIAATITAEEMKLNWCHEIKDASFRLSRASKSYLTLARDQCCHATVYAIAGRNGKWVPRELEVEVSAFVATENSINFCCYDPETDSTSIFKHHVQYEVFGVQLLPFPAIHPGITKQSASGEVQYEATAIALLIVHQRGIEISSFVLTRDSGDSAFVLSEKKEVNVHESQNSLIGRRIREVRSTMLFPVPDMAQGTSIAPLLLVTTSSHPSNNPSSHTVNSIVYPLHSHACPPFHFPQDSLLNPQVLTIFNDIGRVKGLSVHVNGKQPTVAALLEGELKVVQTPAIHTWNDVKVIDSRTICTAILTGLHQNRRLGEAVMIEALPVDSIEIQWAVVCRPRAASLKFAPEDSALEFSQMVGTTDTVGSTPNHLCETSSLQNNSNWPLRKADPSSEVKNEASFQSVRESLDIIPKTSDDHMALLLATGDDDSGIIDLTSKLGRQSSISGLSQPQPLPSERDDFLSNLLNATNTTRANESKIVDKSSLRDLDFTSRDNASFQSRTVGPTRNESRDHLAQLLIVSLHNERGTYRAVSVESAELPPSFSSSKSLSVCSLSSCDNKGGFSSMPLLERQESSSKSRASILCLLSHGNDSTLQLVALGRNDREITTVAHKTYDLQDVHSRLQKGIYSLRGLFLEPCTQKTGSQFLLARMILSRGPLSMEGIQAAESAKAPMNFSLNEEAAIALVSVQIQVSSAIDDEDEVKTASSVTSPDHAHEEKLERIFEFLTQFEKRINTRLDRMESQLEENTLRVQMLEKVVSGLQCKDDAT